MSTEKKRLDITLKYEIKTSNKTAKHLLKRKHEKIQSLGPKMFEITTHSLFH